MTTSSAVDILRYEFDSHRRHHILQFFCRHVASDRQKDHCFGIWQGKTQVESFFIREDIPDSRDLCLDITQPFAIDTCILYTMDGNN
jgi:hypothetical protein